MLRAAVPVLVLLLSGWSWVSAAGLENPFYAFDNIANRGSETLDQKLDDLKAMGYSGLSWSGTDVKQIKAVVDACDKRGLKMHAIYIAFPLTKTGVQSPANIEQVLETLSAHGTVIWVYIQSKDFKPSDAAGDAVAVGDLQKLADQAAKHKLKLALYPHAGFWAQSFSDCLRITNKVDRPNFGVSFNLCHVLKTGEEKDITKLLKEAAPKLFMVSLNGADADLGPKGGWDKLIQPVGSGSFDLGPLLKQLREIGYTGAIGFQGYGIKGDRKPILTQTMEGWKKINAAL